MKLISKGTPALDVCQYALRGSIDGANHYDPTFGVSTQMLANALGSGADGGSVLYTRSVASARRNVRSSCCSESKR